VARSHFWKRFEYADHVKPRFFCPLFRRSFAVVSGLFRGYSLFVFLLFRGGIVGGAGGQS
jgi:hypothetical protein